MKINLGNIFLIIITAVHLLHQSATGIDFGTITSAISRNVFFFLSNCTSGSGIIRLLLYSPYVNASKVRLEIPGSIRINSSLNTVFLIHGFLSTGTKDWVNDTISALLETQSRNVFVVDWRIGACSETIKFLNIQSYSAAVANTKDVGKYVARCIEILVDNYSVSLNDIWIIGHSLGAHVAGFAGKVINSNRNKKLGRITGLDPAGPLFRGLDATKRLDKTDADFVEIVHTSKLLGLQEPIGHVDLYYNGGEFQHSCLLKKPGCSHDRAVDYYLEAIRNPSCHFVAKSWSPVGGYTNTPTICTNSCTIAGPLAQANSARGTFFVQTNDGQPYCTGELPSSETIEEVPDDHDPLDENIFDISF